MCLSSSKVWVRQLWKWLFNDCKTFKTANGGEVLPWRKDTFFFPLFNVRCQLHTCDKYNPTAVIRGWEPGEEWAGGDNISPRPPRGLFSAGVSAHGSSESRWWSQGESLSWQHLSQGWGRGYYTTFTFEVESDGCSGKGKPTQTHRLPGKVGALTLCSPYLPSQSLQERNA